MPKIFDFSLKKYGFEQILIDFDDNPHNIIDSFFQLIILNLQSLYDSRLQHQ